MYGPKTLGAWGPPIPLGGGGVGVYIPVSGTYNVTTDESIFLLADVSTGSCTINLNATPTLGAIVEVAVSGDVETNNVIIDGGSIDISDVDTYTIDVADGSIRLAYDGSQWVTTLDGMDNGSTTPNTILNGTVDPTNFTDGEDGDFYINTVSNEIFGPRTLGAWGAGTSIIGTDGADGAQGIQGNDGADGTIVLSSISDLSGLSVGVLSVVPATYINNLYTDILVELNDVTFSDANVFGLVVVDVNGDEVVWQASTDDVTRLNPFVSPGISSSGNVSYTVSFRMKGTYSTVSCPFASGNNGTLTTSLEILPVGIIRGVTEGLITEQASTDRHMIAPFGTGLTLWDKFEFRISVGTFTGGSMRVIGKV
jgi:hypothetical protein